MRHPLPVIATLLCLTACGEQSTQPAPKSEPAATGAPQTATLVTDPKAIPTAFHGVWAATAADCDAPAETRLEIAADRLRFYESSGPVASVEAKGPAEIHIIVSLTGEGATSQRSFRYRLLEDGGVLFDVRNGLTRSRCPTA